MKPYVRVYVAVAVTGYYGCVILEGSCIFHSSLLRGFYVTMLLLGLIECETYTVHCGACENDIDMSLNVWPTYACMCGWLVGTV